MKRSRGVVYIGGSIEGQDRKKVLKERMSAQKKLSSKGFKVLCPMRGRDSLKGTFATDFFKKRGCWGFIDRDLADLKKSDCHLILTGDVPTDGSWLEFGFSVWKLHIPVVIVAPSRLNKYGWSNRYASYLAKDIDDAIRFIDKFLFCR